MSVLIKGIEMPKKGVYNAVITFDGDSISVRIPPSKEPFSGRIVHVPTPHGDLVDRDDLIDEINRVTFVKRYDYNVAYNIVTDADTIIEAEVSE